VPSATGQSPGTANPAATPTNPTAVAAPAGQPLAAIASRGAGNRSVMLSILALIASAAAAVLWAAAGRARPSTDQY
jgi:hypothetical protein